MSKYQVKPSTTRSSQCNMKYEVIVNIDGYQETISIHNTPDKAIDKMLKAAKATIAECFGEGTEFSAYPTSDERYPDAWGYANNGYCIKRGKSTTQYAVIEMGDIITEKVWTRHIVQHHSTPI